ncbi:MAG: metallophosphoesterase [Candidatus Hodarchaeota archaeon]
MQLAKEIIAGRRNISPEEVEVLTAALRDEYKNLPNLVEIPDESTIFVGDLHGDLPCANKITKLFLSSSDNLIFLGDYADRGPQQINTFNLVMALAIQYPERVMMLRGNHESELVTRVYGFYQEIVRQYGEEMYQIYCNVFKELPLAGMSKTGAFACHGGVAENLNSIDQIQSINRKNVDIVDPIAFQLTWNDPRDGDFEFGENFRGGGSRIFGRIAFDKFSKNLGVRLMFRAHQVFPDGVKFFFDRKLVSVFSSTYTNRVKAKVVRMEKESTLTTIDLLD